MPVRNNYMRFVSCTLISLYSAGAPNDTPPKSQATICSQTIILPGPLCTDFTSTATSRASRGSIRPIRVELSKIYSVHICAFLSLLAHMTRRGSESSKSDIDQIVSDIPHYIAVLIC